MTKEIEKLDREHKCKKCGSGTISLRWVPGPAQLTDEGNAEERKRRAHIGIPLDGDLIQRQCGECGFFWAERPMDFES